jgi:hypothetical protein
MRTKIYAALLLAGLATGTTACDNFLTGPGVSDDPINPTTATPTSLFVAAQANTTVQMEHHLARVICLWMQACSGQGPQYGILGLYGSGADEFYSFWAATYGGGGLLDLRRVQSRTLQQGDSVFAGMAMVLEAYLVGTTADVWGDVPYREASDPDIATPAPDPQQQVYADIQAKLDTAIVYLAATDPSNKGPGIADLSYGGDPLKWTALAHTLKARYYLHTAEVVGSAAYTSALGEAQLGIASSLDDFTAYHSQEGSERNLWYQFTVSWTDFIKAGKYMVELLKTNADPRLPVYYNPVSSDPTGTIFTGADPIDSIPLSDLSDLGSTRIAPDFRQPLVTWAETQLIIAEAAYQTGAPGLALTSLENVRGAAGLAPLPGPPAGATLFDAIMTEKYLSMFQTIETWSDWRRTCIPNLVPAPGGVIPHRDGYPDSEQVANPNFPDAGPTRNWSDPGDPAGCN